MAPASDRFPARFVSTSPSPAVTYKVADQPEEFEQIHRLNYRTFVQEIPQHSPNPDGRLVDKFHDENTYIIGLVDNQVIGMVALRGTRPFSLDQKLPNLDDYLPPGRSICEVRLLAVDRGHRHSRLLAGLLGKMIEVAMSLGFDFGLISATTKQIKLYQHMGFKPFGPLTGSGDALFQPMMITLEDFDASIADTVVGPSRPTDQPPVVMLPGPVAIAPSVSVAFAQAPVCHRSNDFVQEFSVMRQKLCEMVRAGHVEVLLGSGTLANEVIAGQLEVEGEPGAILVNGEFGERLVDQATRAGLRFAVHRVNWGNPLVEADLRHFLQLHPQTKWLWTTHCETSTGILNDLAMLKRLAHDRGLKLCLDSISTIGVMPVDLTDVYLASAVSGKGLAAYPGLSMVFYHHPVSPAPTKLPRYLDLGFYAATAGVPFTHSSNLVRALKASLEGTDWEAKYRSAQENSAWLRKELEHLGHRILNDAAHSSAAVFTLVLPRGSSSRSFGWILEQVGFLISYTREYLIRRNWVQICLMGHVTRSELERMVAQLRQLRAKAAGGRDRNSGGGKIRPPRSR
jgi:aspartate aminotransferase-like enzyme